MADVVLYGARVGSRFVRRVEAFVSGEPIDLSADTLRMSLKRYADDDETLLDCVMGDGLTDIDLSQGQFNIDISATDAKTLIAGKLAFDVKRVPGGTEALAYSWFGGYIVWEPEITP